MNKHELTDDELDERARQQLPGVLEHAKTLYRFGMDSLSRKWGYEPSDDLGYMAWIFSCRQMDHLKSVGVLIQNGQHRDAALISRSMLEGLALVWWPDGPRVWRQYAFVSDWKKIRQIADPSPEIQRRMKYTEEELAKAGTIFHSDKALKALAKGEQPPDDPYRPPYKWAGKSIPEIADLAGIKTEYEKFYRPFSAWLHWEVRSFIGPIDVQERENAIFYRSQDERNAIVALLSAYQSAAGTLIKFFDVKDKDLATKVEDLRQDLTKFLLGETAVRT